MLAGTINNTDFDDVEASFDFDKSIFDEEEQIDEHSHVDEDQHQRHHVALVPQRCNDSHRKHEQEKAPTASPAQVIATTEQEPSEHCVVFGRDKFAHKHPGNLLFRQLVSQHRAAYQSSKVRKRKASITLEIIDEIARKGGRFLKKKRSNSWHQVDDATVYEKVSHALRSAKPSWGKGSSSGTSCNAALMMKKAASFSATSNNPPLMVMPVETPVHEDQFFDLMQRQSQLLSTLKGAANAAAATTTYNNNNTHTASTMYPAHYATPIGSTLLQPPSSSSSSSAAAALSGVYGYNMHHELTEKSGCVW